MGIFISSIIILIGVEFKMLYEEWQRLSRLTLTIEVLNDVYIPISNANIKIDYKYAGSTDITGKYKNYVQEEESFRIIIEKKPYDNIDTTILLFDKDTTLTLVMNRPFAALVINVQDTDGNPIEGVSITRENKQIGITDKKGSLCLNHIFRLNDGVSIDIKKNGYKGLNRHILLDDTIKNKIFVLHPLSKPPVPISSTIQKPDKLTIFNIHFDSASMYLNRAISGEKKSFKKALDEIASALEIYPMNVSAKLLKAKIHYNFAKLHFQSNILSAAKNHCYEAAKCYKDITQDQLFDNVKQLLDEIEKKGE